jgi:hypothetical protein
MEDPAAVLAMFVFGIDPDTVSDPYFIGMYGLVVGLIFQRFQLGL